MGTPLAPFFSSGMSLGTAGSDRLAAGGATAAATGGGGGGGGFSASTLVASLTSISSSATALRTSFAAPRIMVPMATQVAMPVTYPMASRRLRGR